MASQNINPHPGPQAEFFASATETSAYGGGSLPGKADPLIGRPLRKHLDERQCSGKDVKCLEGKGGKCVICGTEE